MNSLIICKQCGANTGEEALISEDKFLPHSTFIFQRVEIDTVREIGIIYCPSCRFICREFKIKEY